MSSGLKALLDAAQYLEQMQDKQVPLAEAVDDGAHYMRHLPAAAFDIYGRHSNHISTRNAVRHTSGAAAAAGSQQVSSSAPAASATFQHTANGLTISSGGSQLITVTTTAAATNQQRLNNSDYEYSNGNGGVTVVANGASPTTTVLTTPPPSAAATAAALATNGRSSEGRMPATQLHGLHNGDLNHNMIVEDARSLAYASNVNGNGAGGLSPTRSGTGGSHYLQMMTSAHQSGAGSQLTHGTPSLGGGGRRRTISSNSNGAGTREVHNKLEKNRRAHLKECYETLKRELPLKDEDRKKTSNLAILGEALKCVTTLQKQEQELEAQVEQLAKDKINSQRRIKMLRRELGPNYEPMFAVMFPDTDVASERETLNDNTSLSSGRGSILYSSSSSLSSGGSNGSTTLSSSPVGAGMQTAVPTAISPVISKTNSNSTNTAAAGVANGGSGNGTLMAVAATSPHSANGLQLQQQQLKTATSASANNSPAGSPTVLPLNGSGVVNVNVSVNGGSTALSLTAKNISAMSLTRGSPTPSTPSPSPSSSSCVSSSSSLISSSSPPMALNGIINGRNVTVSIPSNLKFGSSGTGAAVTGATIGNGTASAAATIIAATSPPSTSGINAITAANSNNARTGAVAANATASNAGSSPNNSLASPTATIATTMATITATAINNAYRAHAHAHAHSRKTSLSFAGDEAKKQGDGLSIVGIGLGPSGADGHSSYEDGEQPAKFIKVYNGVVTSGAVDSAAKQMPSISMVPINNAIGQLQLSQVVGGGSLVVSSTGYMAAGARSLVHSAQQQQQPQQKFLLNSSGKANGGHCDGSANELGRLPGGAELNILPTLGNGGSLKINGAFYHANGKLTSLVNSGGNNGILLKDSSSAGAALTPLIVTATAPSNAGSAQPIGGGNGQHYTANFAQLLAATAATNSAAGATPAERSNNKELPFRRDSSENITTDSTHKRLTQRQHKPPSHQQLQQPQQLCSKTVPPIITSTRQGPYSSALPLPGLKCVNSDINHYHQQLHHN